MKSIRSYVEEDKKMQRYKSEVRQDLLMKLGNLSDNVTVGRQKLHDFVNYLLKPGNSVVNCGDLNDGSSSGGPSHRQAYVSVNNVE